ncbi:hypothetical protein VPH35_120527 [Triticum aestivum]
MRTPPPSSSLSATPNPRPPCTSGRPWYDGRHEPTTEEGEAGEGGGELAISLANGAGWDRFSPSASPDLRSHRGDPGRSTILDQIGRIRPSRQAIPVRDSVTRTAPNARRIDRRPDRVQQAQGEIRPVRGEGTGEVRGEQAEDRGRRRRLRRRRQGGGEPRTGRPGRRRARHPHQHLPQDEARVRPHQGRPARVLLRGRSLP